MDARSELTDAPRPHVESGRVSARLVPRLALAVPALVAVGGLYGVLSAHRPPVVLTLLLAVCTAVLTTTVSVWTCRSGHVRSRILRVALAGLVVSAVLAGAWLGFVHTLSGDTVGHLALRGGARRVLRAVWQDGWFTVWGLRPRGAALGVLWGLEGLLMALPAMWLARRPMVYCEACGRWAGDAHAGPLLFLLAEDTLLHAIRTGETALYGAATFRVERAQTYHAVHLESCSVCSGMPLLSVARVQWTTDDHGRTRRQTTPLLTHMVISAPHAAAFRAAWARLAARGPSSPHALHAAPRASHNRAS